MSKSRFVPKTHNMLKKILTIAAFIGACFFPKVQLVAAGIGTNPITMGGVFVNYICFLPFSILFINENTSPFTETCGPGFLCSSLFYLRPY